MEEKHDQQFEIIISTLESIMKKIDDNGKATQSQIDEVKTGIYALEERVTQLEQKQKKAHYISAEGSGQKRDCENCSRGDARVRRRI